MKMTMMMKFRTPCMVGVALYLAGAWCGLSAEDAHEELPQAAGHDSVGGDGSTESETISQENDRAIQDTIRRMEALFEASTPSWDVDSTSSNGLVPETVEDARPVLDQMSMSSDPAVRMSALEAFGENGSERMPTLLAALFDGDPAVRDAGLQALRSAEPQRLRDTALAVYSDPTQMHLAPAFDLVLSSLRPSLEGPMIDLLRADSTAIEYRAIAAYCLGRMGSRSALPYFAQLAWSTDYNLAVRSAEALTLSGNPDQVKEFIKLTSHPYDVVRLLAAQGLGRVGGREAAETLQIVAASRYEPNPAVRIEAIRWLAVLGDGSSAPVLIPLLNEPHQGLRRTAGDALRQITGMTFGDTAREWNEWRRTVESEHPRDEIPQPSAPSQAPTVPAVPPGWTPGLGHDLPEHVERPPERPAPVMRSPGGMPPNMHVPGGAPSAP